MYKLFQINCTRQLCKLAPQGTNQPEITVMYRQLKQFQIYHIVQHTHLVLPIKYIMFEKSANRRYLCNRYHSLMASTGFSDNVLPKVL